MPADAAPFLSVRGLTKRIGAQEILRGVDLHVASGQTTVIIGRSGGGKSVFLKHLIGLLRPDGGEILVAGQDIVGLSERRLAPIRRKVGILFQHGALFDSMSVEDNVAFPLRESGERDPARIAEAVREALEVVDLDGQQKKMPVNLSGGMKKRVALARAVITRPRCILYDEPTAGLDPVVSDSINRLIRRLQERFAVTSVVVTHDMKSAFDVGDRIAYLKHGRIEFEGTSEELQAVHRSGYSGFHRRPQPAIGHRPGQRPGLNDGAGGHTVPRPSGDLAPESSGWNPPFCLFAVERPVQGRDICL